MGARGGGGWRWWLRLPLGFGLGSGPGKCRPMRAALPMTEFLVVPSSSAMARALHPSAHIRLRSLMELEFHSNMTCHGFNL
jgi:hypothetical protein